MVKGCLGEGRGRPEVETIPYRRPYIKLPIISEVALTYRCNLACRFCYAGQHRDGDTTVQMTTAEVKRVLEIIRTEAQVPSVSFTGGEPTLRDDLPELVAAAVRLGLRVNLISNGLRLTPGLAAALAAAGLDSAQISLEGPEADIHDGLTGVPGSFAATVAAVQACRAAGLAVHTNTTLTGFNAAAADRMPALARSLGLDRFSMNMVIPAAWMREAQPGLLLTYREIGPTILRVKAVARDLGIRFLWYSPTPYCLFNPIAHHLGNKGCAACDGLLSVDPRGRVIPCSSFFEPQGSLLEQPFAEVWHSASATRLREKQEAPAACRTCEHFDLCEGACPLYWRAMGCAELAPAAPAAEPESANDGNSQGGNHGSGEDGSRCPGC